MKNSDNSQNFTPMASTGIDVVLKTGRLIERLGMVEKII